MNICFVIADLESAGPTAPASRSGTDIKGICLTTESIYDFDELMDRLDSVQYHARCQDKFYNAAFSGIEYQITTHNGIAIGQFNYTGTEYYNWTERVVEALKAQHPEDNIIVIDPDALATVISNTGGLTLDNLTGPWKGVIVQA